MKLTLWVCITILTSAIKFSNALEELHEEHQAPLEPAVFSGKEFRRYTPFIDREIFESEFKAAESGFPFVSAALQLFDGSNEVSQGSLAEFIAQLMQDLNMYEEKIDIIEYIYDKIFAGDSDKKYFSLDDFCDIFWEGENIDSPRVNDDSIKIDL